MYFSAPQSKAAWSKPVRWAAVPPGQNWRLIFPVEQVIRFGGVLGSAPLDPTYWHFRPSFADLSLRIQSVNLSAEANRHYIATAFRTDTFIVTLRCHWFKPFGERCAQLAGLAVLPSTGRRLPATACRYPATQ